MTDNVELHTFNNVKDDYLRAFNRLQTMVNLIETGQNNRSLEYLKQFPLQDQINIGFVTEEVKKKGFEAVRKDILKNTKFEDDVLLAVV